MTLSPALHSLDAPVVGASSLVLDVLRLPDVEHDWTDPSALPAMSVGALACHLGRQIVLVADLLPAATVLDPLPSVDEHYHRAAWVRSTNLDDPARTAATTTPTPHSGSAALIERASDALDRAIGLLNEGAVQDVVGIPWQGWALRRDDFLLTRLLEMVVHTDDLAVSLGQQAPEFDESVIMPVVELLARLAVQRHGQSAVVGTLSRRERAQPVWAF